MAVWQFDLHLVPRDRVTELFASEPQMLRRDMFDSTEWWSKQQPPRGYERLLSDIAPLAPSWTATVRTWGQQEGNRVDVVYSGERVIELFARIDARDLDFEFIAGLLSLARHCDCVMVTEGMRLIEPDEEQLLNALEGSPAAEFTSDPAAFLERRRRMRR